MDSSMQPKRRIFGLQDIVVLLAVISLTGVQMVNLCIDPGVGWHLATGEYILKHEAVPRTDPFLFAVQPRPWVSDQWLADTVLFIVYALGSWPLLYGTVAALYLAAFFLILFPCTLRVSGAPILAIAATLLAFKLGEIHFLVRPVVFGFVCFAALAAVVWRRDRAPSPARSPRWPLVVALVPLFVLWANLHPSFVLGLVFLAARPAALLIDRALGVAPSLDKPRLRATVGDLVGAGLASCVNPYGLALHRSIIALGTDRYFMNLHEEWLPPALDHGVGLALIVTLTIIILSFATERTPRSYRSFEVLIIAGFGALALTAVRIIPFFAIAAAVPIARTVANHRIIGAQSTSVLRHLRSAWFSVSNRELRGYRGVVTAILFVLALIADPFVRGSVLLFHGPFGPPADRFPYSAVRILAENATPSTPAVVAAPPEWGGFITGFGGEFVHPIIDDRNTLLGADFYRAFDAALAPGGPWREYLANHHAPYLLLPSSSPLHREVEGSPDFEITFRDTVGTLYKRRESLSR